MQRDWWRISAAAACEVSRPHLEASGMMETASGGFQGGTDASKLVLQ